MILNYANKTPRAALACVCALVLVGATICLPLRADDAAQAAKIDTTKTDAAIKAMNAWLTENDAGDYAKSWDGCSKVFQAQLTPSSWADMMKSARAPMGACKSRTLIGSQQLNKVPMPGGKMMEGTFVVAQFRTIMEKGAVMIETVTFEKESDGVWRSSGYYIAPNSK